MYVEEIIRTKKELKRRVAVFNETGEKPVYIINNSVFPGAKTEGKGIPVEMPQYPEPHRSYASCTVKDGIVVKVS